MDVITVKITRIDEKYNDIQLPEYTTLGAAGADIRAAVSEDVLIPAGKFALVPTNIKVEIPQGYELQVRPRSGLAAKHGITVLNTPGTIDSDYRGEIKILLINFGTADFVITRGERIAQIVLSKVYTAEFLSSSILSETNRSPEGFGTSGTK